MKNNFPALSRRDVFVERAARFADLLIRPGRAGVQPHPSAVERIVVVKPCCLGDMLMATPTIRALSRHFVNAEITVVTDSWTSGALEHNPRLNRLILYPTAGAARTAFQLASRLRHFRFDLGISLDRSPVPAFAMWLAGVPFRAGIDSSSRGVGLSHRTEPEPNQHESDLYLEVARTIGVDHDDSTPEYFVPDELTQNARNLLPRDIERQPLVIIHPGGAVNPGVQMLEKRWPATSFGELVSLLIRERGATIALVGSETDRSAVETVRDFARAPVLDLCGQLSLSQLAALCKHAKLFVGNDSGVSHLASAVGTPTVTIFGPTNPNRYRPRGRRSVVCARASSWNVNDVGDLRRANTRDLPDIAQVPLPQVLNACLEVLGERA
jgi:heptosyltransferase II